MWVEVIFGTYYYLHDIRYICDNNYQLYVKTQKYFDSKHQSVLSESVLAPLPPPLIQCLPVSSSREPLVSSTDRYPVCLPPQQHWPVHRTTTTTATDEDTR